MGMNKEKFYALQWAHGEEIKNHGIYSSYDEAYNSISIWWKLNKFSPHYVRTWTKSGVTTIDYGLHTCFYKITEINHDNFVDVLGLGLLREDDLSKDDSKPTTFEKTDLIGMLSDFFNKNESNNGNKYLVKSKF